MLCGKNLEPLPFLHRPLGGVLAGVDPSIPVAQLLFTPLEICLIRLEHVRSRLGAARRRVLQELEPRGAFETLHAKQAAGREETGVGRDAKI